MENELYEVGFLTQLMCNANLFANWGKEGRRRENWRNKVLGSWGMREKGKTTVEGI